jgi:hypothetical protein
MLQLTVLITMLQGAIIQEQEPAKDSLKAIAGGAKLMCSQNAWMRFSSNVPEVIVENA